MQSHFEMKLSRATGYEATNQFITNKKMNVKAKDRPCVNNILIAIEIAMPTFSNVFSAYGFERDLYFYERFIEMENFLILWASSRYRPSPDALNAFHSVNNTARKSDLTF